MDRHISMVRRTACLHLKQLRRIRGYIDTQTCADAVRCLVLSRLDYGNGVLGGITAKQLQTLQVIQNNAARLVFKLPYKSHITSSLISLHWLKIAERIHFKLCLMVFKCLTCKAPSYLQDTIVKSKSVRYTRLSQDTTRLVVPKASKKYGENGLSFKGPYLWNMLPSEIRESPSIDIFKSRLKTHLFNISFNNSL